MRYESEQIPYFHRSMSLQRPIVCQPRWLDHHRHGDQNGRNAADGDCANQGISGWQFGGSVQPPVVTMLSGMRTSVGCSSALTMGALARPTKACSCATSVKAQRERWLIRVGVVDHLRYQAGCQMAQVNGGLMVLHKL